MSSYVDFRKPWETAFAELLERLADPDDVTTITPVTRRDAEIAYLEQVAKQRIFTRWRDIYTDMAAETQIRETPVELTPAAAAFFGMDLEHDVFEEIVHEMNPEQARTRKVEEFDDLREAIREKRRVALIGDPGAGKTTTLERLADELAAEAVDDLNAPLPLFVRLGAYAGGGLTNFLDQAFGELSLNNYLREGRVFLLLDGLNEMPPEHRKDVQDWLRDYPDVPAVVSCRTLDYVDLKLPLQRVNVLPLDIDRQYLFIGNFFAQNPDREALFWGLAGRENKAAWVWFKQQVENATFRDFWHTDAGDEPSKWELEEHRQWLLRTQLLEFTPANLPRDLYGMLGVTSNPFLLSITVRLYATSGKPPGNRGQLFKGFVDMLFKERGKPAARVRGPWIAEETQHVALGALAYRMQAEKKSTSVDADWAQQVITEALPEHNAEHLLYLAASASILEVGSQVRFTHQLLQEYFAAFQMKEDVENGVSAKKYWPNDEKWWEQTGWEETAVLLAGLMGSATQIVEWLTPVQPHLAYRCTTESGADCAPDALQTLYEAEPPQRIATLAKVRWGNILAERGDTRPGVGVTNGLPDIEWLEIPGVAGYVMKAEGFDGNAEVGPIDIEPFQMAKYPVTYAQYQIFVDAADGYGNVDWWDYSEDAKKWRTKNPQPRDANWAISNRPREQVSWYEAVAFCQWLSARTGQEIRLPTEWEWQWAAAGDTGWDYPWGPEYLPGYANIDEVGSGAGPYYLRETSAVGMYPQGKSPFGVLDMSGNVWEWCLNEYNTRENTSLNGTNVRVLRGGSWNNQTNNLRAAYRSRNTPDDTLNNHGFGCARSLSH